MKIVVLTFVVLAILMAARAFMIYGGADNGTALALYILGAIVLAGVAAILALLA